MGEPSPSRASIETIAAAVKQSKYPLPWSECERIAREVLVVAREEIRREEERKEKEGK